jgi:hypothetical protein
MPELAPRGIADIIGKTFVDMLLHSSGLEELATGQ